MSSIIERLTEGVVNRDMRAEGSALLSKWEKTGLLEGLTKDRSRTAMARLLENQAKELLRESSSMSAGDVEGFAAVAFPIVRRVFAGLIANDLVSVQPMSLPSGLIFFLDFTFSGNLGASGTESDRFGNTSGSSIYGGNRVGSQITGGLDLVGTRGSDLSGPRTVGARGYAYASPSGSVEITGSAMTCSGWLVGNETAGQLKAQQFDPDLEALSGSSVYVLKLEVPKARLNTGDGQQLDYNNLGAITASVRDLATFTGLALTPSNTKQLRRLTQVTTASSRNDGALYQYWTSTVDTTTVARNPEAIGFYFPIIDDIVNSNTVGAVTGQEVWGLEGSADIPEIDIKVDSMAVTAQTKKLKAKWTPELGQDLNAYHNLDAEVELTSILSEQIALEIDREILADLVNGATAATYYWSRSPGLFVNRTTGAEIGAALRLPTSPVPFLSGMRLLRNNQ